MKQQAINSNGNEQSYWDVKRLWKLAENLPVKLVPIEGFSGEFDKELVFIPDVITHRRIIERMKSIQKADLSYPIILAAEGWIMDGRHRLQKALLEEHKKIKVVRFNITPKPDNIIKLKN